MRFFLLSIFIVFIFNGCQNNEPTTPTLKKIHSFNNFDYTKEQIAFFEKEFTNILSIENPTILEDYLVFYETNKSYFLNGKQKVEKLKEKIALKKEEKNITLEKLEEAKKQEEKKEAIKIYKQLAKEGNIKAQRELVESYKINNPELALELLEKLVEQEDIQSMKEYASANIYMVRPVIVQDLEKALETYERLAELGELSSIVRLGNFYEYGYHKSVAPQDKEKALEYYEKAASKGYTIAKKKLYKIYSCKECTPDRYDQEKADALQKELIKNLDKKLSKVLEEKPKKNTLKPKPKKIVKKQEEKLEEKNEVAVLAKDKKLPKKTLATIKCYDMETAKSALSKNCQEDINKALKEYKNISKINIIPILDKSDKKYFQESVSKKDFQESLLNNLATNRTFQTVWYMQKVLKDDSILNISTYYVTSKKSNKGVVIKLY